MAEATKSPFSIWQRIREFFGSSEGTSIKEQTKDKKTKRINNKKRNHRQLEEEDSRMSKDSTSLLKTRDNGQNAKEKDRADISAFEPVPVPALQPLKLQSKLNGFSRNRNRKFKVIEGKLSKNTIRINPNSSSSFSSISSESEKEEDREQDIFKTPTSLQTVSSHDLSIVDLNVLKLKDTDNSRGPDSEKKKISLESKVSMEHKHPPHPNANYKRLHSDEPDSIRTSNTNTLAKNKLILYSRPSSASKVYINYNSTAASQESVSDKEEDHRPSTSFSTKNRANGEEQLFDNDDLPTSSVGEGSHTGDLHNLNWPGKEVVLNKDNEISNTVNNVPKRRRNLSYDPARELNTNDIWSESPPNNSETFKKNRTLAEIMAEKFEKLGNHFLGLFAS